MSGAANVVQRILIVKLSSMGDVVHAMAAVQDIRRALPQARIDWVVERPFAPLVARCQGVDAVIPSDLRRWKHDLLAKETRRAWRAFRARLQQERYDAVIDLQGLTKSGLVAWLARKAPGGRHFALANRTQYSSYEAPARWLADQAIVMPWRINVVEQSRQLCATALGYSVEGAPGFGLGAGALAVPRAMAPGAVARPVVVLAHGTAKQTKTWPTASWVELGRRLNAAGFCVALPHGSSAERALSEAMAAQLDDAWVWPGMGLDTLVDTMAGCAGLIGLDTGLSHIAVALGLRHVQIYRIDNAWRSGVHNARQVSVYADPMPGVDAVWQAWQGTAAQIAGV